MSTSTARQSLAQLFDAVEASISKTSLGQDRWYLIAIACISASPDPEAAADLYLHLISQPKFQTSESRQALIRRLRETLFKTVCLVGVCKPIEAILAISKHEREEDRDYSIATREGWQCDQANLDRGLDWFRKVYTRNAGDTIDLFAHHQDFAWVSKHITYGMYLSDRQILDDLDTELVVLAGIMSQNLPTETLWHIRGTRRIGVSKEDTEVVWDTIKLIAKHFGVELSRVPTVDDVEPEV